MIASRHRDISAVFDRLLRLLRLRRLLRMPRPRVLQRPERPARPLLSHRWAQALAIVLILIMVAAATLQTSSTTAAQGIGDSPPELLNPDLLEGFVSSNGVYTATPAQFSSIQNFEQQAVSDTLQIHGLSSSDAEAVESWGREDALAVLWALITQAIQTPAASRTPDQANVVAWLTHAQEQENLLAAEDAAGEYVKWQGLSTSQYQGLLASDASEGTLQGFLSDNGRTSTGYCGYRSPAPYQSDYTGYQSSSCFASVGWPVFVEPPSYDQFVKWGTADANPAFNSPAFAGLSRSVYEGLVNLASIGLSASIGISVGSSSSLAVALTNTPFTAALFPFSGKIDDFAIANAVQDAADTAEAAGETAAEAETEATLEVASEVSAEVASIGADFASSGVGLIIGAILVTIAVTVNMSIHFAQDAKVPVYLANAVANARDTTPDLGSMLTNSTQLGGLFSLFTGAALPTPRPTSCNNTVGSTISAQLGPCLNAPDVFDQASGDPVFAIQAQGSTTTTYSPTLSWQDTALSSTTTARLHESWFVDTVSSTKLGLPPTTVETLRIQYTDWNGNEQTGWLYHTATGYYFVLAQQLDPNGPALDLSTCIADGTCAIATAIDYIGTDGNNYSASVVAASAPTVAPAVSPNPVAGSPATLTANASTTQGTIASDSWQFLAPGTIILACNGTFSYDCTDWGTAVTGASIQYTFPSPGQWQVKLTATGSNGASTSSIFSVDVGEPVITGGSPSVLTLDFSSTAPLCKHNPRVCDVRTGSPGWTMSIGGYIVINDKSRYQYFAINWGDGSPVDSFSPPIVIIGPPPPTTPHGTLDSISDSHVYAKPGTYTVTVTAYDDLGFTVSATATYTIMSETSLAWNGPTTVPYGSSLGVAQPVPTPDVYGAYTYVADGNVVNVNTVLPAGSHNVSIILQPYAFEYADPAVVSETLDVIPAPLTIKANDQSMTYGGTVPSFTTTDTGLVNGDQSSVVTGLSCGAFNAQGQSVTVTGATPAGKYTIACSGAAAMNYSITYQSGTLTINQATPAVNWSNPAAITYGAKLSVTQLDAMANVAGSFSYTPPAGTVLDAGQNQKLSVTFTPNDATDYANQSASVTLDVNPAPLTITARDETMIVGSALPTLGWTGSGWQNGDGAGSLTTKPACTTTATSSSPVGTYPISCGGAVDGNYAMSYTGGTLTISYGVALANGQTAVRVNQGFWAMIELKLENGAGQNLSSRTLRVMAENLAPAGQSWDGQSGNFVHQFEYGSSSYRLLINSRDLSAGSYTLSYEISGDPAIHTLTIEVSS